MDEKKKRRPEEDVKKKKLLPLLREAYTLGIRIEKILKEKRKFVSKLIKSERDLSLCLSKYKTTPRSSRDISPLSTSRSEKSNKPIFNYKNTMCPLGIRCPNDARPRWPSTKTIGIRQMGHNCPYAHHYSELHFK